MKLSLRSVSSVFFFAVWISSALPARAQCLQWDDRFFTRGMPNGYVRAIAKFDYESGTALYVAGAIGMLGQVSVSHIAAWDGSAWQGLAGGVDNEVNALAVFDDGSGPALYVGGKFSNAGDVSASRIAKWNGSEWSAVGSGVTLPGGALVNALAVYDDGSGPALYVGGEFDTAGGVAASNIARWNGTSWSAVGAGTNDEIYAFHVLDSGSGEELYVGGTFTTAGGTSALRVAKWSSGGGWSALGSGMGSTVYALGSFDEGSGPVLFAGGSFTTAGGGPANRIARFASGSWSALGGGMDSIVYSFTRFDDGGGDALYVGGSFTTANGGSAAHIARWNGSSFATLGTGCNSVVRSFAPLDDGGGPRLYVGGQFALAGGKQVGGIGVWDGAEWNPVDTEGMAVIGGFVRAFARHDDGSGLALYAGGDFTSAGDKLTDRVAKWNGTSWSRLGNGIDAPTNRTVRALASYDDGSGAALFAAGRFTSASGVSAANVAKWNGTSWSALGAGVTGGASPIVNAAIVFDDGGGSALFVGGVFTTAGGASANNIAKWNGTSWSALGTGLTGTSAVAYALAVFDDGAGPVLFAAGEFSDAGGVTVNRIAKWNGTSWAAAGGFTDDVYTLAVFNDGLGDALYAGGLFTTSGSIAVNRIAKRTGPSTWQAVGGMGNAVYALHSFGDGWLYAGGIFNNAGGAVVGFNARWDGADWIEMSTGTNDTVYALDHFDGNGDGAQDLYVGGEFTTAGNAPSYSVAAWSGCPIGTAYCFGDGIDPLLTAACPCGNFGLPNRGCANTNAALGGARLWASGTTTPNTVTLSCNGIPNNTLCTFLRSLHNDADGAVFGDGVFCLNAPFLRFGQQFSGQSGNAANTVGVPSPNEVPGNTRYYVLQYRNPAAFCTAATFNASNGYSIGW